MTRQPLEESVVPQSVQRACDVTRAGIVFSGGDDMLTQFLRNEEAAAKNLERRFGLSAE
jgi:hypothetical protein